jgi:L-arabinose 1- dehydrogenase
LSEARSRETGIILVGAGKIARDQHVPTIEASGRFKLISVVSGSQPELGVPVYKSLEEAISGPTDAGAVVLCTPPSVRIELARTALVAGCALMIEKPPATSVVEARTILRLAEAVGQPVFASWHSRCAPMVETAAAWVGSHDIVSARIVWHESVHKWHPGQSWLWEQGGFGVYDPGINSFSILTYLLPGQYRVLSATYEVPSNSQTPIAAELEMVTGHTGISVSLDFRYEEDERWEISLRAADGQTLKLSDGGATLQINDAPARSGEAAEYAGLYEKFGQLIDERRCDFDLSPLEIIENANGVAVRHAVAPIFN